MMDVFEIQLAALSYAIEVCGPCPKEVSIQEHSAHILGTAKMFSRFVAFGANSVSNPVVSLVPNTDENV